MWVGSWKVLSPLFLVLLVACDSASNSNQANQDSNQRLTLEDQLGGISVTGATVIGSPLSGANITVIGSTATVIGSPLMAADDGDLWKLSNTPNIACSPSLTKDFDPQTMTVESTLVWFKTRQYIDPNEVQDRDLLAEGESNDPDKLGDAPLYEDLYSSLPAELVNSTSYTYFSCALQVIDKDTGDYIGDTKYSKTEVIILINTKTLGDGSIEPFGDQQEVYSRQ